MSTASPVPLTPGIRYPQDYSIENLTILSATGAFDLKNIRVELSYHEDLFNNTASGYLMLSESMNYVESLNLNGNEFLRMTFSKTGDDSAKIDKLFRIYKLDKRKQENTLYTISYCLYFCSEEQLLNEQYKVCKAYPGQLIIQNVVDILTTYLKVPTKKFGVLEPTYGLYDFVVPTLKPFDAINWMSVYARPTEGALGSDMIFFENKYGFNYRSLQSMISTDVYHDYSYNPKNTDPKNLNQEVYNVLTYEIMNSFDTLNGINSGAFANQLISADILTRTKKVTNFNYADYQSDYNSKQLNNYPVINSYENRFGEQTTQTPQAVLKLIFSNYNEKSSPYVTSNDTEAVAHNIYAETYVPYRTAQLSLVNYTRIKLSVAGDPNLTVGMTINFSLKSTNPNDSESDSFYSGKYIITAVRHLINDTYKTVLEIAKDSTTTQYASPDMNSTIWQNTVKGII